MNQEQLLDHVAELLRSAAQERPGAVLLYFDDDFKTVSIDATFGDPAKFLACYNTGVILNGLPPSEWLKLSKQVWACKSTSTPTIKIPPLGSDARGKPGRKPKLQDEDPKTG